MAGHNKWSKIKRKKGAEDAKRSKIFSRIIKEINVAVKEGGSADPDMNPRLRLAVQNAKGANMPKDTMERAIKKASEAGGENYQEVTFEGMAPGGIAIYVECMTDNNQRTVSNIRMYFNKNHGELGKNGSLDYLFTRKGVFVVPQNELEEEEFTLEMIDAGADDVELDEGIFTIYSAFENFGSVQKKLEEMNVNAENAELQRIPNSTTELDIDSAKKVLRLLEVIEDDEDVQNVYHNLELTDELAEQL